MAKNKKKFVIKTSFFKDLKAFLLRGNVIDLAVAVIIGTAFGKITSSLVADIIMPPIALAIGEVNLSELAWTIRQAVYSDQGELIKAAVTINYGNFLQVIIEFLIIGITVFCVLRLMTRLSKVKFRTKEEAEAAKKAEEKALADKKIKEEEEALKATELAQRTEDALLANINSQELLKEILEVLKSRESTPPKKSKSVKE